MLLRVGFAAFNIHGAAWAELGVCKGLGNCKIDGCQFTMRPDA